MGKITAELARIQKELIAPKNQRNLFGNYDYRSCEDITSGFKKVQGECALLLSDEIVAIKTDGQMQIEQVQGNKGPEFKVFDSNRIYVKATATLVLGEETISVDGWAREEVHKKGMDASQITGATSSYARKYALNRLFAIDDTKDADDREPDKRQPRQQQPPRQQGNAAGPTPKQQAEQLIHDKNVASMPQASQTWVNDAMRDGDYNAVIDYLKEV